MLEHQCRPRLGPQQTSGSATSSPTPRRFGASRAAAADLDTRLDGCDIDADAKVINATPLDSHPAPRLQLAELRDQGGVGADSGVPVAEAAGVAPKAKLAANDMTFLARSVLICSKVALQGRV